MIRLINGRGQLGEKLKSHLDDLDNEKDIYIYHTWNPWAKDRSSQKQEYTKFINFVDQYKGSRIILISTYSQNENYYVYYKQLAESYLIVNCANSLAIRLPNLIGKKGILKKFKDRSVEPYGKIELMTLDAAAAEIVNLLNYDGLVKILTLKGEEISAALAKEIITQLI